MEFKLCECILPNGEMCARYIAKTEDLYCCEHVNSNSHIIIKNILCDEQPNMRRYFCSMLSGLLLSSSFFCGKRRKSHSAHPNTYSNTNP